MKPIKGVMATVVVLGCVLFAGSPASAEWFADVFVGPSFTQSQDVRADSGAGRGTFLDVEFDTGVAYGGRFGNYFDALPFLGVAVDYFNFSSDISRQTVQLQGCFTVSGCGVNGPGSSGSFDVSTIALSVDLMLRLPLFKTADAPQGRVQPYLTVGLPVYISTVTPRRTTDFRNHHSDTNVEVGYMAGAGIAFHVYKNLALFGEYRFNHVRVEADLEDSVSASKSTFKADLDNHSALVGISARW
jgi:opacity protein-like surface antigen